MSTPSIASLRTRTGFPDARPISFTMPAFFTPTAAKRTLFYLAGDTLTAVAAGALVSTLLPKAGSLPGVMTPHLMVPLTLALLAAQMAISSLFSVYSIKWSTFSLADLPRTCAGPAFAGAGLLVVSALGLVPLLSPGLALVWTLLTAAGAIAVRSSKRFYTEVARRSQGRRALLVVCSEKGYFLLDALRRIQALRYNFVGFVDPEPVNRGSISQGLPVLGSTDEIERIVREHKIATVFVFLSYRQTFVLTGLYQRLQTMGIEVKTIPSFVDLVNDRADLGALERLSIHELTGRPPVVVDVREMQRVFGGKRILVTGAGGSIGSELCRQLARFGPSGLVLFERDDSNLFYIENELHGCYPGLEVTPFLGDVTREDDVNRVFAETEPDIVFHAAAYKHVPILEFHPDDAVRVNVLGSHLLARTAARHGTDCFVYVSTDKAVNPTSVMGASKRIGEMVVTSMNGLGDVRFCAVRFGNVLDSRGSVSTIFRDAINKRRPVTVTDPEMRRYFMLTSEAVLLVMQAVALSRGGEVFVLDMGEPVRITDLAETMIRHAGLVPNRDIPIIITGRRPGEKLFEELLTAEEGTAATANARIWQARISRQHCYPDVIGNLDTLADAVASGDNAEIRTRMYQMVATYQPDPAGLGMKPTACGNVSRPAALDSPSSHEGSRTSSRHKPEEAWACGSRLRWGSRRPCAPAQGVVTPLRTSSLNKGVTDA